jgi:hypothetical protein
MRTIEEDNRQADSKAAGYRDQLKRITDQLLLSEEPVGLRDAAASLHSLFSEIVSVDLYKSVDTQPSFLPKGKAVSPQTAALCVLDYLRTVRFLRGINAALVEAQARFPTTQLEILYAGCGPFATLVLPLLPRFDPHAISLTLLDVHERSLQAARIIVEALGLTGYVRDYVSADATIYEHPRSLHVVITETMDKALTQEPQVSITLNVGRQLCDRGIFIPEQITVDACLYDPAREFLPSSANDGSLSYERVRVELGRLIKLRPTRTSRPAPAGVIQPVMLGIPEDTNPLLELMLLTKVKIFGSFELDDYESGVTSPLFLGPVTRLPGQSQLEFKYMMGNEPGFRYRCT